MCKLLPCENPTKDGVWWRDDKKWCLYSEKHQAAIKAGLEEKCKRIQLGTIVSTVHPNGAAYVVDTENMEQVAVSSGQKRPIMIIEPETETDYVVEESKPAQVQTLKEASSTQLKLHYEDNHGNWQRYDPDIEKTLHRLLISGSP